MAYVNTSIGGGGAFSNAAQAANGDLYVTGDVGGLFKSTNGGLTWTPIGSANGINDENLYGVDCHPGDPDIVIVAGEGGVSTRHGLLRSTNATTTCSFTPLAPTDMFTEVRFAPSDGSRCYAVFQTGVSLSSTASQLYVSNDAGATFTAGYQFTSALPTPRVQKLFVDPLNKDILYALSMSPGTKSLARSANGGTSFARIGPPSGTSFVDIVSFAIDPNRPTTLYATSTSQVYKSVDSGVNWQVIKTPGGSGSWLVTAVDIGGSHLASIDVNPDAEGSGGSFRQNIPIPYSGTDTNIDYLIVQGDNGIDQTDAGYAGNPVLSMAVRLNGVIGDAVSSWPVTFDDDTNGAFSSAHITADNNGAPWTAAALANITFLQGFVTYPVGSGSMGGVSSIEVWTGKTQVSVVNADVHSPTVYTTVDRGANWTTSASSSWQTGWKGDMSAYGLYSNNVYGDGNTIAYGRGQVLLWITSQFVFKSVDGGLNYTQLFDTNPSPGYYSSTGLDNTIPTGLSSASPTVVYATLYDVGILRSDDAGVSWKEINSNYGWGDGKGGNCYTILADPSSPGKVWASQSLEQWGPNVLLRSIDYGESWQNVTGMPPQVFAPAPNADTKPNPPLITGLSFDPTTTAGSRTLYCCVGDSSVGTSKLYKSTDDGRNWAAITTGGIPTTGLRVTACSGTLVMVGGEGGLWRSNDSGASWGRVANSQFPITTEDQIGMYHWKWHGIHSILINGTDVWVCYYNTGTAGKGLYKSTDSGATFGATAKLADGYSRNIIKDSAANLWHTSSSATGSGGNATSGSTGLKKSSDNGNSWVSQMSGLPWTEFAWPVAAATDASWVMFGQPGTGFWKQ